MTNPSSSDPYSSSAQVQSLYYDFDIQVRALKLVLPPSSVDTAPAPVLNPSGSSTSHGALVSVLDSPLQAVTRTPRFFCDNIDCSESFALEQQLKYHARKHKQKDRVHACNECSAIYTHSKNLRDHRQSKHQGKRYKCDVEGCEETVAHRKNMRRHKETKHGSGAKLRSYVPCQKVNNPVDVN